MKHTLTILSIFFCISLFGQNTDGPKGNVSFISSQNVYVQFVNTNGIHIGDTLYFLKNNKLLPALIVKDMSSISCVGSPIQGNTLSISNQIFSKNNTESQPIDVIAEKSKEAIAVNDLAIAGAMKNENAKKTNSKLDGRVSISSYLNNTSDSTFNNITRFNLSFNAKHIGNSKLSAECYLSYTNKNTYSPNRQVIVDTAEVGSPNYRGDSLLTKNLKHTSNDLRIYNLSLKYDFDSTSNLTFGRKINNNLANVGAVDGLQFEKTGRNFSFGAVLGSRPDTYNYGINTHLLQFGAYLGYQTKKGRKTSQSSVALFNQWNNMLTDRRFVYIQHSNSLLKNLDLFCSLEIDLYGAKNQTDSAKVKDISGNDSTIMWNNRTPINMIDLTSAYVSLNYRPWRNLSMSLSYDARKNVYYYETYKSYVDSLLDKETRQGFRFQTSYRPFKRLTWGANAGYRLPSTQKVSSTTTSSSANAYTYLTYSQLPFIGTSLTINASTLKTPYFTNAMMYGGTLSRDFLSGKIFIELSYSYVDFTYISASKLQQSIGELSLSWRIAKKLMLSTDFEATKEIGGKLQGRAFVNISQRF